jgi:hypothetical protein
LHERPPRSGYQAWHALRATAASDPTQILNDASSIPDSRRSPTVADSRPAPTMAFPKGSGPLRPAASPPRAAASAFPREARGDLTHDIKCIARIRLADLPAARKLLGIAEGDEEQARTRTFGLRPLNGHAPGVQLFLMRRYFTITSTHWAPSPREVRLLSLVPLDPVARANRSISPTVCPLFVRITLSPNLSPKAGAAAAVAALGRRSAGNLRTCPSREIAL